MIGLVRPATVYSNAAFVTHCYEETALYAPTYGLLLWRTS